MQVNLLVQSTPIIGSAGPAPFTKTIELDHWPREGNVLRLPATDLPNLQQNITFEDYSVVLGEFYSQQGVSGFNLESVTVVQLTTDLRDPAAPVHYAVCVWPGSAADFSPLFPQQLG